MEYFCTDDGILKKCFQIYLYIYMPVPSRSQFRSDLNKLLFQEGTWCLKAQVRE